MSLVTPEKISQFQRKLYKKAKQEPTFRFYQLYDKVYRGDILEYAYRMARSKKGAPGVDGITFEEIEEAGLEEWKGKLEEELRTKTYKPDPVRRVKIPKPGGGERPLGIPTIKDRVVQTAAKIVLEPIFEADFKDSAYGYRPGRSAQSAVKEVHQAICKGYTDVVDADLSRYFDTIPHNQLMQSIARRVVDRQMLKLIKMWLKAPIQEEDKDGTPRMSGGKRSKEGIPQGGVISPLLANIYMNRFLKAWQERGKGKLYQAKIINYADDFVILSKGCAKEAMEWTKWAMKSIGLNFNEDKTCLRNALEESFDFLGYSFGPEHYRKDGHWYLAAKPSKKAIQRLKETIRRVLRPGNMGSWEMVRTSLNRILVGWANYFSYGTRLLAYRAVDNYVYKTVLRFLCRRHKIPTRGTHRYPAERVFGEMGVIRLRRLHVGPPV